MQLARYLFIAGIAALTRPPALRAQSSPAPSGKAASAPELQSLPDDHADAQAARFELGVKLYRQGDLTGARAVLEMVLEVRARTLADDHPDLTATRQALGVTIRALGDLAGARALHEKVLEVRSRSLPADHVDLQKARQNLVLTLRDLGDLAATRALEEEILDVSLRTLGNDHAEVQRARLFLAVTLKSLGELAAARTLESDALEALARTLPDEHADVQLARSNLAASMYALGDIAGARVLFEKVLDVALRTRSDEDDWVQVARSNVGAALLSLGDVAGAQVMFEKVLEVRSRTLPDDDPLLQTSRGHLASTLFAFGDFEGARALQAKVLEVLTRAVPEDHPALQLARQNLALSLRELEDLEGARALEERVLDVRSRTLPEDHPEVVTARANLAGTLKSLGDLEGGRALEEQALEVAVRTLPEDHPDLQRMRGELATTIAALALRGRQAGQATTTPETELELRAAFRSVASAFSAGVRRTAATAISDASSREAEERISSEHQLLGFALSHAAGMGVFENDPKLDRDVFLASETMRATALASARRVRLTRDDDAYADARSRIEAASADVARLAQSGAGADESADALARLERAERELVRRATELSTLGPSISSAGLDDVAARVPDHAALVAYRRYPRTTITTDDPPRLLIIDSLCAFVLRRDRRSDIPLHRIELGPIAAIEAAVRSWRDALGVSAGRGTPVRSEPAMDDAAQGEALRALVLDPLREHLADIERVMIVPDDALHAVPLDALPVGAPWRGTRESDGASDSDLLGAHLEIELRSSAFDVLIDAEPPSRASSLLAIGGVDFGTAPGVQSEPSEVLRGGAWERGFPALAGTEAEVLALCDEFATFTEGKAGIVLLDGSDASRERMFEHAPAARYLHVATHGWFAPESIPSIDDPLPIDARSGLGRRASSAERVRRLSPMVLSGLALCGANAPPDATGKSPGLLTAQELAMLDLSSCELAVLSACDTNVGVHRAGQGMASLQRALHMAGARSVITSLWKVPDEATKELMLDFYRRLWVEKKPKHQALWEAKQKLRDSQDQRGKPRYSTRDWAAWVLTGERE